MLNIIFYAGWSGDVYKSTLEKALLMVVPRLTSSHTILTTVIELKL